MYVVYVMYVTYAVERDVITRRKSRIADTSQVGVRPSSHHAHTLRAQDRKLECDRHRNLGAHCNRRITDAASCGETAVATCAHLANAESPTHCKLRCDRHRNLGAHCNRRITDASQVAVRPSSQLARTLQAQGRQRIASCGASVIATWVHSAIAE